MEIVHFLFVFEETNVRVLVSSLYDILRGCYGHLRFNSPFCLYFLIRSNAWQKIMCAQGVQTLVQIQASLGQNGFGTVIFCRGHY